MMRRMLVLLLATALVAGGVLLVRAAVSAGGGERRATEPSVPPPSPGELTPRELELTRLTEDDLTRVLTPDSIPSIDDPVFLPVGETDFLSEREPLVALEIDGDARAYPLQIMTWHEIVNDEVGGIPVAVTYCPLCNSALAYDRRVGEQTLEFGTSGSLYNSALVMFDRQTDTRWLHFEALAVIGELEGIKLELIPVQILSWAQFADAYPGGSVLSRETGFSRPYGENPYDLYDTDERPFLFKDEVDPRMGAVARVVGVEIEGDAAAYPYEDLRAEGEAGVIHDTLGGQELAVFWKAGVASALDTTEIALGRDVGSSGVFVPRVGQRELRFEAKGGAILDRQTGSTWSLAGEAVSGPLQGARLQSVSHLDTFWFAWAAHHPETAIVGR